MSHLSRTFSRDLREFALKSGESRRDLTHFVMIAEGKEEEIARLLARIDVLEARVPAPSTGTPIRPGYESLTPSPLPDSVTGEYNPHGLVAFYTDAPLQKAEPPRQLKGLGPSRMRLNGAIGTGILPAEQVAHAAGIVAEFTARGFREFKFGFDNEPERNRPWVECISPLTWEESTDNEEYACRMICAMNGTEYRIPTCPKCGITFRQRYLAANREVTCSACGHQYQDPT